MRTLTLFVLSFFLGITAWLFYWPSFDTTQLHGKRVIVCGASTGIGEQIAYVYASAGARIVLASRRDNELQRVQTACKEKGAAQVERLPVDLSSADACGELIRFAKERLGGIDALILNHIIGHYKVWSEEADLRLAEKILAVNTLSYIYLTTHALPELESSHGTIAVVSSIGGKVPSRCTNVYCASKFALHGFFDSLRLDLAFRPGGTNVSISLVPLGLFGTDSAIANTKDSICLPSFMKSRYGDPADAAAVVVQSATMKWRETFYPAVSGRIFHLLYALSPTAYDLVTYWMYLV